jgi:hypothetical protein
LTSTPSPVAAQNSGAAQRDGWKATRASAPMARTMVNSSTASVLAMRASACISTAAPSIAAAAVPAPHPTSGATAQAVSATAPAEASSVGARQAHIGASVPPASEAAAACSQ